jgi:hypothetical protein
VLYHDEGDGEDPDCITSLCSWRLREPGSCG